MSSAFQVVVVGGGPAGIAAATCAAECGQQAAILDDNIQVGGQIWRGSRSISATARSWYERLQRANVKILSATRVFDQPSPGVLRAEHNSNTVEINFQKLILATGARERFLPFPGWTLPNVIGAGGLQALVKSGLPVEGKRIVVAGSGPLLIAVAAYLRKHGASIAAICEQAPLPRIVPFAQKLLTDTNKLRQAIQYSTQLIGVPFRTSCWPVSAQGKDKVESVTLRRGSSTWTVECDYLACGFHLVPNTELAELLRCRVDSGHVVVDEFQATTMPDIYSAGESTGIGGVELSLIEGQIAGYACAEATVRARALFPKREKLRRFAQSLESAYELRSELRQLPHEDTIVCRCEDVRLQQLSPHTSWRAAKLHTRCGMGPCQGRICGAATEFLFGWNPRSTRPPLFPALVSNLIGSPKTESNAPQEKL